jgi:hypothetical protein
MACESGGDLRAGLVAKLERIAEPERTPHDAEWRLRPWRQLLPRVRCNTMEADVIV